MEPVDARPLSPWLEGVPLTGAPLTRDGETEVVVVGAGAAGLSVALSLAEAGRSVIVLEQRSVASGLSGRGAGELLASGGRWLAKDERELGLAKALARRALSLRGRERARALAPGLRELDQGGSTMIALSPREWSDAERTHALLAESGEPVELFAKDGARTGSPLFGGGLYEPRDFCVDPAALLRELAKRAIARGVRLCEGTPVMKVEEPEAGGVLVRTARGVVRAAMVVLAVNAWTPALLPLFGDRVRAHRAQALLTAPLPHPGPGGVRLANHGHEHWRRLASGALLFGGCRETSARSEELLSEDSTGKIQGMMERFVSKAFPGVGEPVITHRWAAAAASTCDGLPVLGPLPGHGGIVLCAGFGEHELALAIGAGMQTADLLEVGRVEEAEVFSAHRFL